VWTTQDRVPHPLYVVTTVFDPMRYHSRWELYRTFQKHVRDSGAVLVTIEAAFGDREFAVTQHAPPYGLGEDVDYAKLDVQVPQDAKRLPPSRAGQDYLKVRLHWSLHTSSELWLKECLINRAIQHLPPDWRYVAWIDADVFFVRPDWVPATLHALQHAPFVQMFSESVDVSPDHEVLQRAKGWVWCHRSGMKPADPGPDYRAPAGMVYWHPGFAWAARRDGYESVGGLIDWEIMGAADWRMARALTGQAHYDVTGAVHPNYRAKLLRWEALAERHIKRNLDFVPGLVVHRWHGRKRDRGYHTRWRLIQEHQFDPETDLARDSQGIYYLTDYKPALRDGLRAYFRARNEDSIDIGDGGTAW